MTATQEQINEFIRLKMERKTYFFKMKASNTNLSLLKKNKDPSFKDEKEKHLILLEGWKKLNSELDKLEDIVGKVKVPVLKREKTPEEIELAQRKKQERQAKKEMDEDDESPKSSYIFPLLSKVEREMTYLMDHHVFPIVREISKEIRERNHKMHIANLLGE